jgi:hypothetical protein
MKQKASFFMLNDLPNLLSMLHWLSSCFSCLQPQLIHFYDEKYWLCYINSNFCNVIPNDKSIVSLFSKNPNYWRSLVHLFKMVKTHFLESKSTFLQPCWLHSLIGDDFVQIFFKFEHKESFLILNYLNYMSNVL